MKKLLIYIFITIVLVPAISLAQDTDKYTLLEPLPCIDGVGDCSSGQTQPEISISDYVGYIFKFSIALAAFLAVIMIIYAGFEYMLSESLTNKSDAKDKLKNAITGLIMIFSSYLILRTIDPRLVQVYTSIPPIKIQATKDIQTFSNKLDTDLKTLSEDSQLKVNELKNKNLNKQSEIDTLRAKSKIPGSITDDEIARLKTLEYEVQSNKAQIIKIETEGKAGQTLLDTINNKEAVYKTYSDAQDKINATIKSSAEEMKKLGDLEGAQKLEKRGKFFSDQIQEEGLVYGNIAGIKRIGGASYAKEDLAKYKKEYEELSSTAPAKNDKIANIKNDPELISLYTTIVQARIEKIQNALK